MSDLGVMELTQAEAKAVDGGLPFLVIAGIAVVVVLVTASSAE